MHEIRDLEQALLRGAEQERAVVDKRSAERPAHLTLLVVEAAIERVGRGQRPFAVVVEPFAMQLVGSRLGDHVHESAIGPPDFGGRAAANHLELAHGGLREEEHAFVAAALVSLQRVVEIGAVDGDVRVDRSLTGDDQTVPIAFLRDGRRQLHELGEVASPDWQHLDGVRSHDRARRGVVLVEPRHARRDGDRLRHVGDFQAEVERLGRADRQANRVLFDVTESLRRHIDHV